MFVEYDDVGCCCGTNSQEYDVRSIGSKIYGTCCPLFAVIEICVLCDIIIGDDYNI